MNHERTIADYKPEIHFIGQVIGGTDFDTSESLFCEISIKYGEHWTPFSQVKSL
ncbi:MAG: hypothetical protein COA94_08905 [Rickettsiales bacterium]|nr:MAG: hypothetical protein COA94_08905 [Rickettsiales bacterium]